LLGRLLEAFKADHSLAHPEPSKAVNKNHTSAVYKDALFVLLITST